MRVLIDCPLDSVKNEKGHCCVNDVIGRALKVIYWKSSATRGRRVHLASDEQGQGQKNRVREQSVQ
jgi:hypothetical protein